MYLQAFPGCALGLAEIGYVMMCFGIADVLSSMAVGFLENIVGRIALFTLAITINLSILAIMVFWEINSWPNLMFYVIPAMWGVSDAVWQTTTLSKLSFVFYIIKTQSCITVNTILNTRG